ncbi:MAG: hypothetical protein ACI8XV_002265 [Arenicella sp.]|jgi:hypothetical protein
MIFMKEDANNPASTSQKLHEQTALIAWKELQRFFAQGVVMWVDDDCDLVEIGTFIVEDQAPKIEALVASTKLAAVSNLQAKNWFECDAILWSLVVAPFVLVQERPQENAQQKN